MWNKEAGARGAVLYLQGFGTWGRRDEVVTLVGNLMTPGGVIT